MRRPAPLSWLRYFALVSPLTLAAQGGLPPLRTLATTGMVEHDETFSRIKSVVELPDGRVVVADASEKKVVVLDFQRGTATSIAREGEGPREFRTPGGVSLGRGGGAMIYDQQQRRFLPVLPNGTVADAVALPIAVNSFNVTDQGPDQFVPDTLGNVASYVRNMSSGGMDTRLVRYAANGTESNLGTLRQQDSRAVESGQQQVMMRQLVRFSPADVWAQAPDGWVAVVEAEPYRVRWIPPRGAPVTGPTIAFTPLPVTDADREAVRQAATNRPPASVTTGGPGGRTSTITPPRAEPLFAAQKPAFPIHVPPIDRAGRVWVQRTVALGSANQYDVFDRRGTLVDRVTVPEGLRIVGFGPRSMYLIRTDSDDLLHIRRYPLS